MLNCREATQLMSEGQDRSLTWRERSALRLHLWICSGCTNFRRHLDFLRRACQRLGGDQP